MKNKLFDNLANLHFLKIVVVFILILISSSMWVTASPIYIDEENKVQLTFDSLHLFNWNEIPGNDNARLIDFLKQTYGIDWVEFAKIEKTDADNAIRMSTEKHSLMLRRNNMNTIIYLKVDDLYRGENFRGITENDEIKIYYWPNKRNPTFSTDGSKIAYVTQNSLNLQDGNSDDWSLWVVNVDGTNQQKIFDNLISRTVVNEKLTKYKVYIDTSFPPSFSWNKEGDKILISKHIIDLNLNYFMFQSKGTADKCSSGMHPNTGIKTETECYDTYVPSSWSIDNRSLYSEEGILYILDSLDKNPRKLMDVNVNWIDWNDDGKKFAMITSDYINHETISTFHIVDLDTMIDSEYYGKWEKIHWIPNDYKAIYSSQAQDNPPNYFLFNFETNESLNLNLPFTLRCKMSVGYNLNMDGTKIIYVIEDQIFLSNISSVRVDIQSNPSDSDIYIDNKSWSKKAPNYFYSNPCKIHTLMIKKSGYEDWETIFKVNSSWGNVINLSANLIQKDSDNDGWGDKKEIEMGTDPNKKDTDNDGMVDPKDPNPLVYDKIKIEPLNRYYLTGAGLLGLLITVLLIRPALKRYNLKRKLKQTPTDWCPHCHKFSGSNPVCPHCGKETLVYVKSNIKHKNK